MPKFTMLDKQDRREKIVVREAALSSTILEQLLSETGGSITEERGGGGLTLHAPIGKCWPNGEKFISVQYPPNDEELKLYAIGQLVQIVDQLDDLTDCSA